MMNGLKRILAFSMALVMLTGLFSVTIAEEILDTEPIIIAETNETDNVTIDVTDDVTETENTLVEGTEPAETEAPVVVAEPTAVPEPDPTPATTEPTAVPTTEPTPAPTAVPTATPTAEPTAVPTPVPTAVPTPEPNTAPAPVAEPVEEDEDDWFPDEDELIEIDDDVFIEVEETPDDTEDNFEEEFDDDGLLEIDDDEFIEGDIEEPVVFTGHAYITIDNKGMLYYGDEVTLRANVENANMDYTIIWEATDDNGEHWERLESGESISFILTQWNANRQYRIILNTKN